jgi:hypothetical protein
MRPDVGDDAPEDRAEHLTTQPQPRPLLELFEHVARKGVVAGAKTVQNGCGELWRCTH